MTALAGLPAYLELGIVSGLSESIRRRMKVWAGRVQGWTDRQVVMVLVLLNLAGGDCVDDMRVLDSDEGFVRVLERAEFCGLKRKERREEERRWRKEKKRVVPSPSVVFRYLTAFSNPLEEAKRGMGHAYIPAPNKHLIALRLVNRDMLGFAQRKAPQGEATLDQDGTLVFTAKADALWSPQLPFPTLNMGEVRYKMTGVVTNRDLPGDDAIRWYRGRCGKCEEVHAVMKNDLAGGHLPSGHFGANAAWWAITVLAYNLNSLMKRLVMPEGWVPKRLKAIRFGLINVAGRVVTHARHLIIRLSQSYPAYGLLVEVRRRIHALAYERPGLAVSTGPP
jgi:hypothetical protein